MNTEDKVSAWFVGIAGLMYFAVIAAYIGFWGFICFLLYKLVMHFVGH